MITLQSLTSVNYPIQTVLVRKCGASFLRELFYYLDHFELSPKSVNLEKGQGLHFEKPLPRVSPVGDFRFVFYRNPLDRLVGFYYDQVFYDTPAVWPQMRERLVKRGLKLGVGKDLKAHRRNLAFLLDEIENMAKDEGLLGLPDMLAPQYKFLLPAIDMGFEPIDLLRSNFQLAIALEYEIPKFEGIMTRVMRRIKPFQMYNTEEIVSAALLERHQHLYEADYELYWAQRDGDA